MSVAAAFLLLLGSAVLTIVTLVQMFYLESLRLRVREFASQQFFREVLEPRLQLKIEEGAQTFSLVKHSLLALFGCLAALAASGSRPFGLSSLLEAAAVSWSLMLFSSYVVPQFLYRKTQGRWLIPFIPVLRSLVVLVRPLAALLAFLDSLTQLDEPAGGPQPASQQENLEALITAGAEEGLIEEEDQKLIRSVVAFGDKTVREVMTPRPKIVAVPATATLEELRQLVIHEQYSRIPVYEDTIDQIIGFVHVRDMFEIEESERPRRTVRELLRPIPFVPETKPVSDLLSEMQRDGNHMAIVIDEYGNTAGLVTMEDLVEEIVGEIRDEHEPAHDVAVDETGGLVVSGSFDLDHLQELIGFRPNTDVESTTVGGLVTEWLGRVPRPGEIIERDGIRIEVLASNDLRVDQVRITRLEAARSNV
jgi:CBS domain containing-hemolysin-like protein